MIGLRMLIFILTICIVFSGCIEENNVTQSNESVYQGPVNITPENLSSTTLSSKEENIPEIEITSFSCTYMHDPKEKVYDYFFCWDNIPGNENQSLIGYLQAVKYRNDQEISWGNHVQLIKSDDNKTIRVYFSNSTKLMLEDNKDNVLRTPDVELKLREVNGKYRVLITPQTLQNDELEGKEVNGKLCIYKVEEKSGYNITERYYAIYGLSIKNNGTKDLDFKLNELSVRHGDNIFNSTIEPYYWDSLIEVQSDLEKETKLEDTTLAPGQTMNGSVVFEVNSLYNKSFLLMYNETPVTSASFEKSIEALSTAERYNYSVIFGIAPYNDGLNDTFEYSGFSNWVNRSIFEVYNKADIEFFNKDVSLYMADPSHFIQGTEIVYALRVIPERNITVKTHFVKKNGLDVSGSPFKVVDDSGEELINSSRTDKIGILKNQTYGLHSVDDMDISEMNFSNATIIRISFFREIACGLILVVNQNVIVDNELNIVAASNNCRQFLS